VNPSAATIWSGAVRAVHPVPGQLDRLDPVVPDDPGHVRSGDDWDAGPDRCDGARVRPEGVPPVDECDRAGDWMQQARPAEGTETCFYDLSSGDRAWLGGCEESEEFAADVAL